MSASSPSTPATVVLDRAGVGYTSQTYEHDPSVRDFGAEAVAKLGFDSERVLKTLVVAVDSGLAVAVVPVQRRLDLKVAASVFGSKRAVLADPAVAERRTGYVVGGISPVGQRVRLPTVVDASAVRHSTVLVSGGRRGFDVELRPEDLIAVTGAMTALVARV